MGEISCCGVDCAACEHYPATCPGCAAIGGKAFWTQFIDGLETCEIYVCCVEDKELAHCGKCAAFPCALYTDSQHEDPTKTPEENQAILRKQIALLRSLE